ncbi:glycosyltransferase involved in cell wall biosynthesis [Cellulomonas humilata]|uniref:D-inositol 3-phosphate glycosyltransferase n=2 Tax=Cellulomonas humilata TaxID=144055 RepID=A0ABU0EG17_9CELL|nr:glycosyltransferase involved in cell wall biosynthesis [Cellulomonas humilata]
MIVSHSRNPLGRILNYVSFGLSSRRLVRNADRFDAVYVYAPQLTAAIGPRTWSRRYALPYVLHVQDVWPDSIVGSGMLGAWLGRGVGALLGPWIRSVYRSAGAVVAIAPSMAQLLVERGASADRTSHALNWSVNEEMSAEVAAARTPQDRRTTVTFAGNLGEVQALDVLIRAASRVRDVPGLVVEIVGSGVAEERLRDLAQELGADNVRFLGRVDAAGMRDVYLRSDFQLVSLADLPLFRVTVPSKLAASLACGVPVVVAVAGDAGQLVRDGDCGLVVAPGDDDALVEALRSAARSTAEQRGSWGRNARQTYESKMSARAGIDTIEHALLKVLVHEHMESAR